MCIHITIARESQSLSPRTARGDFATFWTRTLSSVELGLGVLLGLASGMILVEFGIKGYLGCGNIQSAEQQTKTIALELRD